MGRKSERKGMHPSTEEGMKGPASKQGGLYIVPLTTSIWQLYLFCTLYLGLCMLWA